MKRLFVWAIVLSFASASWAAEVWRSTFDTDADGVVDIFNDNPSKVTIGTASGGMLPLTVQDSTSFAQTDRAGRPLGATLNGHNEYSGLATFMLGAPIPAGGQTWNEIGFSGSGSNPGIARQVAAAFLIWNHDASNNVVMNLGLQWGSSSGNDRNNIVGAINLGSDANAMAQTFQLAISYLGDFNGNTNSPDPTQRTGTMRVDLYDGFGTLLKSVVQGDITTGDGGSQSPLLTGLGGEPASYTQFLSNQALTHLGVLDYVATASGRNVIYNMDSLAWYDTFDGARGAVVPEPSTLVLLGGTALLMRRRRRL